MTWQGEGKVMKMFLSRNLIQIPALSSKWLFYSLGFLVFWQILDGFTTKIGLDLGLAEVGTYAMGVLGNYGFWGLMAWKFGIIAAVLATILSAYYFARRYDQTHLSYVTIILTVGCFIAGLGSAVVVGSNISQIELALRL
jgi:hypothetical protein